MIALLRAKRISVLRAVVGHELEFLALEVVAHLCGLRMGRLEAYDLLSALIDLLLEQLDFVLELADAALEILLPLRGIVDDVRDANPERLERRLEHRYDEIDVLVRRK